MKPGVAAPGFVASGECGRFVCMTSDISDFGSLDPDDPFGYGSRIEPGHPLYAQVFGAGIIADVLRPAIGTQAELAADLVIASLLRNSPPIYLVTEDEVERE